MKSPHDLYTLRKAGDYARPRKSSQALPLVYGDLSRSGEGGGLWEAVCLDTQGHVYAYSGAPVLAAGQGNQVRAFGRYGDELHGFDFNPCHDLEDQGEIATLTFSQDMAWAEPIALAGCGRADGAGLLVNPLDVARDFLLGPAGLEPAQIDNAAWARARAQAEVLGYQAAGVIAKEKRTGQALSELLSCFLGSWWLDAASRLRVSLMHGPGLVSETEVAMDFGEIEALEASVQAELKNLCNRLSCSYAFNWAADEYEARDDGAATMNLRSRSMHGEQARELALPWVRAQASARAVQTALVRALGRPMRIITLTQPGLAGLHAERGDYAWLTCPWLRDQDLKPLANQLMRILAVEPDLDKRTMRFTLLDTGFHKTLSRRADGSIPADGSRQAGGERDRLAA